NRMTDLISWLIIDVAHLFWAAWHRRESSQSALDSAHGDVEQLAAGRDRSRVLLAVDIPPYTRAALFPPYHAQRVNDPDGVDALRALLARLKRAGWRLVGVPGQEADDAIATFARRCRERGEGLTVATGDKDLWCLVPGVTLLEVRGGGIIDEAAV